MPTSQSLRGIARRIADLAVSGPLTQALARRHLGRHLHDHEPGPVRDVHQLPDHQPAAGGDPVHRRGQAEARRRRPAPTARSRSPSTRSGSSRSPSTTEPSTARTPQRSCVTSRTSSTTRDWAGRALGGPVSSRGPLRVRWLGRVRYQDAHALQHALFRRSSDDHLLLMEHTHVYTLGVRARPEHVLVDPAQVGAELVRADRGGDVTYHGPGQLVGYPILSIPMGPGVVPRYVHTLEQLVDRRAGRPRPARGGPARRLPRRVGRPGRSGPAQDLRRRRARQPRAHDARLRAERRPRPVDVRPHRPVRDPRPGGDLARAPRASTRRCATSSTPSSHAPPGRSSSVPAPPPGASNARTSRAPIPAPRRRRSGPWRLRGRHRSYRSRSSAGARSLDRRLAAAGVDPAAGVAISERKPEWLRVRAEMGGRYLSLRRTMRELKLVTVCEEAGCPNIYECWADGTATFMINGERCTRACGFCLVDTRQPAARSTRTSRSRSPRPWSGWASPTRSSPRWPATTSPTGGRRPSRRRSRAIRARRPGTTVEVLISDCKGDPAALADDLRRRVPTC